MVRIVAAAVISGLPLAMAAGYEDGFHVYAPSKGMATIADRTYTVKWTGNRADSRVEIDLFYCGPDCGEDECGEWVTSLCPYGKRGCPDNEGDYDVVMPEPMAGTEAEPVYKVRVMDVDDKSNYSCSGRFTVLSSDGLDKDGFLPGMTVTSPRAGDMAYAGETYTVLFDYYNEVGDSVGRFNIDLYESDGGAGCGTYVTTICDKPEIGCKDSMGDYDVEIPENIPQGVYKVRVSPFEDPDTYDCSGEFSIVSDFENDYDMDFDLSYSFSYGF